MKIRIILAVLLLLVTIQSTFFFLGVNKVSLVAWMAFNACAVANITFLIGFILFLVYKNRTVMYMAVLPLFFFGTGGLFIFPWGGMNIISQIAHIIMTLNVLVLLLDMFREKDFKAGALGLLLSIGVFAWFVGFQQNYYYSHADQFHEIMDF